MARDEFGIGEMGADTEVTFRIQVWEWAAGGHTHGPMGDRGDRIFKKHFSLSIAAEREAIRRTSKRRHPSSVQRSRVSQGRFSSELVRVAFFNRSLPHAFPSFPTPKHS